MVAQPLDDVLEESLLHRVGTLNQHLSQEPPSPHCPETIAAVPLLFLLVIR